MTCFCGQPIPSNVAMNVFHPLPGGPRDLLIPWPVDFCSPRCADIAVHAGAPVVVEHVALMAAMN